MDSLPINTMSDRSLFIKAGTRIDPATNRIVTEVCSLLDSFDSDWIEEVVPSYTGVTVFFNPLLRKHHDAIDSLQVILEKRREMREKKPEDILVIPVCYDREFGPDTEFVCKHNGLDHSKLIELHIRPLYLVYMLGFTPGFPYLGGMDPAIATPRRSEPRIKIPAGSVGIAGEQTGVYPIDSPGGWQLIGRTPVRLFNPDSEMPFLVKPGMYIEFKPVDRDEYNGLEIKARNGTYKPEIKKNSGDERDKTT
jgi:KipI family sensor histidine kinase inhibitor